MTCCFFSSLKTLLMPTEPIRAPVGVNVPGLPMAGFQLTLHGRIWVTPEARDKHRFKKVSIYPVRTGTRNYDKVSRDAIGVFSRLCRANAFWHLRMMKLSQYLWIRLRNQGQLDDFDWLGF